MNKIKLEDIATESSRQGIQSVTESLDNLNKSIKEQGKYVKALESQMRSLQKALDDTSKAGGKQNRSLLDEGVAMANAEAKTYLFARAQDYVTLAIGRLRTALGSLGRFLNIGLATAVTAASFWLDKYREKQEKAAGKVRETMEIEGEGRGEMIKSGFELEQYIRRIKNFTGTKAQEADLIGQMNDRYGETFGTYSTLADWYVTLSKYGREYINMLFLQAKIQGLVKKAMEADAKGNEKELSIRKGPDAMDYVTNLLDFGLWAGKGGLENYTKGKFYTESMDAAKKYWNESSQHLEEAHQLQDQLWEIQNRLGTLVKPKVKSTKLTPIEIEEPVPEKENLSTGSNSEDTKKNQAKLEALLSQYKDYTQKRKEIEEKHNADIFALQEERSKRMRPGNEKQIEQIDVAIAQATTDKGKALVAHDYEQLKQQPDYVRAFENLQSTSAETLNSLLGQLEKAKQEASRVLSPDQLKEYTTSIQLVMDELDSRNPFKALAEKKQELADAEAALARAQVELNEANSQAKTIKGGGKVETESTRFNKSTGKIDYVKGYMSEAQALENVKQKTDNYNKAKDNVIRKAGQVQTAEKKLNTVISDLAKSITEVGKSIGGVTGNIISLIGSIGTTVMGAIQGLNGVSKTASASIQAVEKASVILAIIGAAVQIATKIASLLGPKDGEEFEANKKSHERLIKVWDALIARKKEYIAMTTGEEAAKAGEEALDALNKQREATKKLAQERLKVANGSHSMEYRMWKGSYKFDGKNWKDVASEIEKHTGNSFKNMRDLTNMSSKDLIWIQENYAGLWSHMDGDFKDLLESMIKYGDTEKEILQATEEALTQISFDSLFDSFLDTLLEMDSSAEDFADDFEGYLRRAILNGILSEKYKDRIRKWYETFGKYNKEDGIDATEYAELKKDWDDIVAEAIAEREALKELHGWTSTTSQEAQSGSFTTMTQDQGTKLEGLFTSLQDHTSSIDYAVIDISRTMYAASDKLSEIARNTSYCVHLEQMAGDIAELKRDGIKMK